MWSTEGDGFDPDTPDIEVFLRWFFHRWALDPMETSIEDESLHDRTPTSVFLEQRGTRLDPVLRRYLEACLEAPFSFHEVLHRVRGRSLRTRDLFTGSEHDVLDKSASATLRPGDAFFGMLVSCEGVTLIEACAPHVVPAGDKLGLIDFRERIAPGRRLSHQDLHDWVFEIRETYLNLADRIRNPRPPHLSNTDGDDVLFHHLVFDIDSPHGAFAVLADLALATTAEELLEEAELGPDGEVLRVTVPWVISGNRMHASWDNTILGSIRIDGHELVADVNSAERARRLETLLQERLGDTIRHRHTRVQSVDEAMSEARSKGGPMPPPTSDADAPELREALQRTIESHYESWISEPIPALGGLTPTQALGDPVGREKVEALIADMERRGVADDAASSDAVIARLRERLGLVR